MKHRAVITGMGVITPVGSQLNEFWNNLITGKSGIGLLTRFDTSTLSTKVAGEVKNFEPTEWIDKKESRHMDRFSQFAIAAAKLAVQDSGLDFEKVNKERAGAVMGCGIGGVPNMQTHTGELPQVSKLGRLPNGFIVTPPNDIGKTL